MNSKWRLDGKKCLVTGASRGIGRAAADELASLGAEVISVSRTYSGSGGMKCDVTSEADRKNLFDTIKNKWGKLDVLVNNAGTNNRKQMLESSKQDYDELIQLNQNSIFALCKLFHPLLRSSGAASVINITSVAGQTFVGTGAAYAISKSAANQLTRYLAVEWAKDNIRVNAVAPWYIKTPLTEKFVTNKEYMERIYSRTPMKRMGTAEEVAAACAFLAMPASSYITGEILSVDGGFLKYGF